MPTPRIIDDGAYHCLRLADFEGFHEHIANRATVDFSNSDLRGVDLRAIDPRKVILRGAYLRDADLRGLDLRDAELEGCSLRHAQVSGTFFPANVSPQEIQNSVEYGTRVRTTDG
ncbi:MAG: hypothetical protein A2W31_00475 [Planctomycetes bacterium RBG_16_64_10]|nr:MAG: hypothetical protein A2W31_00475 [Planctomycetes bacterium RBG_16_64_10]